MARYSDERKQAILVKMLPPHNLSVASLAASEGISEQTLYNWRKEVKLKGTPVPGPTSSSNTWSAEAKLAAVIETASLSEVEVNQYCRKRGLYPEQLLQWKKDMLTGVGNANNDRKASEKQRRDEQREIKKLKKELRRKDKALAETTALLVLQKKLDALWQQDDGEE